MGDTVSRRGLLVAGGGAALGTLGALGMSQAAGAAPPVMARTTAMAAAALPTSQRFNLTDASDPLFREKPLRNATVLQSFAFDNVNRRIYVAQVLQGGLKLAEPAAVSGADRDAAGDLCITQLDFAGNQLGQMYLLGFGHGVSIGAEPVGSSTYLWTETDAVSNGETARGSSITRFPFVNRAVLTKASPMEKHKPVAGATNTTASVDFAYGQLIVRYSLGGRMRISAYDLTAFKSGNYTPIATVDQPDVVAENRPFQGYTSFGRYLYLLEGSAYGTYDSTVANQGNTYLTTVDFSTGAVVQRAWSKAAYSLSFREPEGMAVQLTNPADLSTARLCFGFASGVSGARLASIYYKDLLI
ncbi:phage baseplate protein [Micromonospora sp. NPDC003197]